MRSSVCLGLIGNGMPLNYKMELRSYPSLCHWEEKEEKNCMIVLPLRLFECFEWLSFHQKMCSRKGCFVIQICGIGPRENEVDCWHTCCHTASPRVQHTHTPHSRNGRPPWCRRAWNPAASLPRVGDRAARNAPSCLVKRQPPLM